MASTELAATYAALILADAESEITSEKILALTTAAGVELEPIWATLLAKALEGKNVKEMLSNISAVGSAPVSGAPADTKDAPANDGDTPADADADGGDNDSDSDGDLFGGGLFD